MTLSNELQNLFKTCGITDSKVKKAQDAIAREVAYYPESMRPTIQAKYEQQIRALFDPTQWNRLNELERELKSIQLSIRDFFPHLTVKQGVRLGVLGWGVVAPSAENTREFRSQLESEGTWMTPFTGFAQSNFWVGKPKFDFSSYKSWIVDRFGATRYANLEKKFGDNIKMCIAAFIQALEHNPTMEHFLQDLGSQVHVYVGTAMSDMNLQEDLNQDMYRANRKWERFWAQPEQCSSRQDYENLPSEEAKNSYLEEHQAPPDPERAEFSDEESHIAAQDAWYHYWAQRSERLRQYLTSSAAFMGEDITGDVEQQKVKTLKKRLVAQKRLQKEYGCPDEPWAITAQGRLWNIDNIMAAQISMMGKITGLSVGPSGACSTFGVCLEMALNAIQTGRAKVVVVGAVEPVPQVLEVACFNDAKVLSNDGKVCMPMTGLRGTHVSGGSSVWIVGDVDYLMSKGMKPLGCEVIGIGTSSDADHIITPSNEGPKEAIRLALADAGIDAKAIQTWDCHATATPGDYNEVKNITELIGNHVHLVARKGQFGHGMAVCGGWEMTAVMMGVQENKIFGTGLKREDLNEEILKLNDKIVTETTELPGPLIGKTNMGVGGINAAVVLKQWDKTLTPHQYALLFNISAEEMNQRIEQGEFDAHKTTDGSIGIPLTQILQGIDLKQDS